MLEFIRCLRSQPGDALALECGPDRYTYEQLWEGVSRVAGGLRQMGAGPEKLVGLGFPKSIDYVLALLGCWWAGAAYVPLDPGLPEARLQAYQSAARPDLILRQLPWGEALEPCPGGELAYVYCTSGSTGAPKAVEITHAGLVPLLREQIAAFDLGPGKRMLWLLSIQFDASLSDLGTALLSGATLVLADGAQALPLCLERHKITHLDIPPALLKHYQPEDFPDCLETLVAGGEPSDPATLRNWARRYRLISVYGPTEATICTSLCQVTDEWQAPRLGLPLAAMEHRLHEGELLIAGPGLFRGYRHRPDLSQAACLWLDGRRYYRSGDRVRALPDGDFEFLGRSDRQVKVRGHRIELAEVESAASQLGGLKRCAAVLLHHQLTLFYVGHLKPHEVRQQLAMKLPDWMLPSRFQALERMPETTSGKPDYLALQATPSSPCLDSLSSLEMAARLQAQGHAVTAVQLLKGDPLGMSCAQLRAEVPTGMPALRPASGWGRRIFLTGATGQLGSRLLQRFLQGGHQVIAMVRGGNLAPHPNLSLVRGDITAAQLGLAQWDRLAEEVDVVFHCAAQVNTVLPWDSLRATNLDCLPELLRFCAQGRAKAFHYASTLSVFVSSDYQGVVHPHDLLQSEGVLYGGYAQTKWAAEWLLQTLQGPRFIYRYGLLTADSRSGASSPRDYLRLFARGLRGLGCYPQGRDIYLDITPVDFAVEATYRLATQSRVPGGPVSEEGETYHIASPTRVSLRQLVECLNLEAIPAAQFFALTAQDPAQAAAQLALCRLHPEADYMERNRSLDLFQRSQVDFQVSDCGLGFPTLDVPGLRRCLLESACTE